MKKIDKVVIPVAGLGIRMFPATKVVPKEMLPVSNKPIIQLIVEEVINAGFKEIIFITNPKKSLVIEHFKKNENLEKIFKKKSQRTLLNESKKISKFSKFIKKVIQKEPLGLGHAILSAKKLVGRDHFAVVLPDMILENTSKKTNLSLMKKNFDKNKKSSILLGKALKKDLNKYGIAKVKRISDKTYDVIESIIEKPSPLKAPSNYYAVGRYIFNNKFFDYLEKIKPDNTGEIQLTTAIEKFLKDENNVNCFYLKDRVFDCGDKSGYLKANIEFNKKF